MTDDGFRCVVCETKCFDLAYAANRVCGPCSEDVARNHIGRLKPGNVLNIPIPKGVDVRVASLPAMTLRDYFAGQALAGFMVDPKGTRDTEAIARASYLLGDAMLADRQEERDDG